MKSVHWFALVTLLAGVVLLFAGQSAAGGAMLLLSPVVELIYAAMTGKKTNSSTR